MSKIEPLIQVRVAAIKDEAMGIRSFELHALPGHTPLPAFKAGAHIEVHLASGLVRQYSLCSSPHDRGRYTVAVLHAANSRGGSAAMHSLTEGQFLDISPPRNHFPLQTPRSGEPVPLLLAGGIGITPLLAMARELVGSDEGFELRYACRTEAAVAFRSELEALTKQSPISRAVKFHLDDGPAAQRLSITDLLLNSSPETDIYVCGPQGFIEAVLEQAGQCGWPDSKLHFEYFGASVNTDAEDDDFEVRIASTGRVFRISRDASITSTLAKGGVEIPVSCEQGVCGTCMTEVVEGEPDHRDHYLGTSERESNKVILPCCSRSKSRTLVLAL